jgi:hypothetical protein
VKPAIVLDEGWVRRPTERPHDLVDFLVRQLRVEAMNRGGQPTFEQRAGGIGALAGVVDVGACTQSIA